MKTFKSVLAALWLLAVTGSAWGESATGAPAEWPNPMMGEMRFSSLFVDRLEYSHTEDGNDEIGIWDIQGWYGTDKHKLWLKSEGEGALSDKLDSADLQLLYSRMISPFFDLQLGVRQGFKPDPRRTYAVVGVQGLAPYWIETDAALHLSEAGDLSLHAEFEYDLLFTQRLILQPRLELGLSAQDVPDHGVGQGLTEAQLGFRLRYEIRREFAPYVGISWARKFGDTAEYSRLSGDLTSTTSLVIGVRFWY